ncbi:hypothetical protein A3A79_00870 [Candidatus Gottesmanbacteria bacterium RIFCSPLOWO2_01_FULL_43_11b]|uniref:Peptidase C39-like domain-containing protein n=1 Tax=Candidatus Gottesmanbacteria bacterium RIFCSPLOWO2_01_FULL_43_11b TaxID=1798392 RepID=A0A1F6AGD9_9BACT|nr:MAG: hypothetical protein A3A79_00870 [Candidatus Gottesmanbacteria bacterium RIFCSPLOWO2_01_FULL_43_11b]
MGTEINARVLRHKDGVSPHMVLIFAKENGNYLLHDPGLQPMPNFSASWQLLTRARRYAGKNSMSLVGFKK